MISQASKELKEVVYKAKEILANYDDIRHALNIAMGLMTVIAYMNTHRLIEKYPRKYSKIEDMYNELLEEAEIKTEKITNGEKQIIKKLITYMKHPKYRYIIAIMTKTKTEPDYTFT